MTSPIQPNVDPSQPPVAGPQGQGNVDDEIRQLATALAPEPVTAMSGEKAVIDSISLGGSGTPPTVTVNLGGVLIPGVAIESNYTPQVGDTVLLLRQGTSYLASMRITAQSSKSVNTEGGWTQASLASGNGHRSGSAVMYRRVMDNGCWKMQWKGLMDYGNSSLLASALAADFRPSESRPIAIARSLTGGMPVMRLDFDTDGTATFWGATFSTPSDGSHTHGLGSSDVRLSGYLSQAGTDLGHSHGLGTSGSGGSHTHDITAPPWLSLNGVEYFL
jgi:hypothetical protein